MDSLFIRWGEREKLQRKKDNSFILLLLLIIIVSPYMIFDLLMTLKAEKDAYVPDKG